MTLSVSLIDSDVLMSFVKGSDSFGCGLSISFCSNQSVLCWFSSFCKLLSKSRMELSSVVMLMALGERSEEVL